MNILDYKRKARGYTFRGGYDEGGGTDMGYSGPDAGYSSPDAGPSSGVETGLTGGTPGLGLGSGYADPSTVTGYLGPSAETGGGANPPGTGGNMASPIGTAGQWGAQTNPNAGFSFNANASTLGKAALGGILGGPVGFLGGLLGGVSYNAPTYNTGAAITGYSSGSDTTSGGFSGGPGGGSDLAGALLVASGITAGSGATAGTGAGTGAGAANPADPFAPYRADLAKQYAGALTPGASRNIQAMPGYSQYNTGIMQPAMMAAQRAAAAGGNLYGGGEKARLQTLGQQGYYNFMNEYMNRLAQGSGAVNNPATAVGLSQEAARDAQRIQDANQKATMSNIGFGAQTFGQFGGFDFLKNLFKGSSTPYSSNGWQNTSTDIYGQSGNTPWWLQSSGDGYSYY